MKIAIIGAGAAGCFAAANMQSNAGDEVIIFEKTGKSLQKVKVSGGGRCNVTHACYEVPTLIEKYPRGKQLLKKTLYQFGPKNTIDWFESRGVQIKEEVDGRMFPITNDSQSIIDCLMKELDKKKIKIEYHKGVEKIEKKNHQFQIQFSDKTIYIADKILIACGGFPKTEQYKWLTSLGHTVEAPVPSLFTFNMPGNPITELMGLVVQDVIVKISGTKISSTGPLLITHWGMSGPAILRTSAWAARELADKNYEFSILINWLNGKAENKLREEIAVIRQSIGKQLVVNKNPFDLPKRFWEFQLWKLKVDPNVKWGEFPAKDQNKLIEALINDRYEVKGKTTFKEEFVTCGGINLSEVDPSTMESRIVPGMFFAGEILNVDGITGGFNFQHAWASGFIAGKSMLSS
jgi:predicted Rossmann fold flavoprotein